MGIRKETNAGYLVCLFVVGGTVLYGDFFQVDYGSALACYTNGQYTLSGIYSWDTGCKQEGQIGGYVAPDVDWIEVTLAKPIKQLKALNA